MSGPISCVRNSIRDSMSAATGTPAVVGNTLDLSPIKDYTVDSYGQNPAVYTIGYRTLIKHS
jgi:hypothetical protein